MQVHRGHCLESRGPFHPVETSLIFGPKMKFCQRTCVSLRSNNTNFVLFYVLSLSLSLARSLDPLFYNCFFFLFIGNTEFVETRIVHALDVIYTYMYARARSRVHAPVTRASVGLADSIYTTRYIDGGGLCVAQTSARKSPSTQGARELLCAMFKLVRGWRSSTATPEGMKACASNWQLLLRREKWGRVLRTVHPF